MHIFTSLGNGILEVVIKLNDNSQRGNEKEFTSRQRKTLSSWAFRSPNPNMAAGGTKLESSHAISILWRSWIEAKEISKDDEGDLDYHGWIMNTDWKMQKKIVATFIFHGMSTIYDGHTRSRVVSNYECTIPALRLGEKRKGLSEWVSEWGFETRHFWCYTC